MILRQMPGEMIPIMGMVTGMVSMVLIALVIIKVAQGQVGQAIARRLQGKGGAAEAELRSELLDMKEHVAELEHRLGETEERLDFAERLLAHRDPGRLEGKPNAAG
jgi:hypothetical protein